MKFFDDIRVGEENNSAATHGKAGGRDSV